MRVLECGLAADELDAVQLEIFQNALPLHLNHFALVVHEVVYGQILFQRVIDAVQAALLQARKVERGFAERLAGHRAAVDAASADNGSSLDDGHPLAEIGRLGARLFSGGSAADHHKIERFIRRHFLPQHQAPGEHRATAPSGITHRV